MIFESLTVGALSVNCYLIGCESTKKAIIIDPGDNDNDILESLHNHNLELAKILITHGHVDHVGKLESLKKKTSAQIYMHKKDLLLFSDLQTHAQIFGLPDPGNPKIDVFIEEGDTITLGTLAFSVLHTPGHSAGSVTYKLDDMLFVGDLIFAGSIGRTDLPGGDYNTIIDSIESKIFTLPDNYKIYPGHGPVTTVGKEKSSNPFFK